MRYDIYIYIYISLGAKGLTVIPSLLTTTYIPKLEQHSFITTQNIPLQDVLQSSTVYLLL